MVKSGVRREKRTKVQRPGWHAAGMSHQVSCGKQMSLGSKEEEEEDVKVMLSLWEEKPPSSILPPPSLTLGHSTHSTSFQPAGLTTGREAPHVCAPSCSVPLSTFTSL